MGGKAEALAPRRADQVALCRATLAVGGMATGSHAQRRTSAVEEKSARYKDHLKDGKTTKEARQLAVQATVEHLGHLNDGKTTKAASELAIQDVVEHLGHSRNRMDLAAAYLLI